jgi:hypothetical protein
MQVSTFGMDKYRIRRTPTHWTETPEISRFYTAALERLATLPGVQAVASTSNLPPRNGIVVPFDILGKPNAGGADRPDAAFHEVSPAFFDAMKIPVRGRVFTIWIETSWCRHHQRDAGAAVLAMKT